MIAGSLGRWRQPRRQEIGGVNADPLGDRGDRSERQVSSTALDVVPVDTADIHHFGRERLLRESERLPITA